MTTASETLRLELAPLDVKVMTIVAGNVETRFWANESEFILPVGSYYKPIESSIADAAAGKKSGAQSKVDEFARQITEAVIAGGSGALWKGALAGSVKWASKVMPTGMLVSRLLFSVFC